MARQSFSGVSGISICLMPSGASASSAALITQGMAPTVPASPAPFTPSGVITVTTDFGHRGPFVGTMKGVIIARYPNARLVDLTHEVHVHWPAEAGFWLERSYQYFPPGTVHLAVVDPGVGSARRLLAALASGHTFVAPDNGLLTPFIVSAPVGGAGSSQSERRDAAVPPPFHDSATFPYSS